MDRGKEALLPEKLPFDWDEARWGEITDCALACPGVYWLETRKDCYYVVLTDGTATAISSQAMAYGIADGGFLGAGDHPLIWSGEPEKH